MGCAAELGFRDDELVAHKYLERSQQKEVTWWGSNISLL